MWLKKEIQTWCECYFVHVRRDAWLAHLVFLKDKWSKRTAIISETDRFSGITFLVDIYASLNNSGWQKLRSTCYKRIALRIHVTNQFLKRTKCANRIHGDNPRDFIFSLNSTGVIAILLLTAYAPIPSVTHPFGKRDASRANEICSRWAVFTHTIYLHKVESKSTLIWSGNIR